MKVLVPVKRVVDEILKIQPRGPKNPEASGYIAEARARLKAALRPGQKVVWDATSLRRELRSLIVTPVMWGGRAFGAIELVNPLDGAPFSDGEGHALSYIAEQFAEFIGSHGLVIEPDKIVSRAR
jgi:hypothetical protein